MNAFLLYFSGDASPCRVLNGGCEDICTLDERSQVVCRCSPGRMILADGRRCAVRVANCTHDQFECTSGFCIPYIYSCDGVAECHDGSDEDETYCRMYYFDIIVDNTLHLFVMIGISYFLFKVQLSFSHCFVSLV